MGASNKNAATRTFKVQQRRGKDTRDRTALEALYFLRLTRAEGFGSAPALKVGRVYQSRAGVEKDCVRRLRGY